MAGRPITSHGGSSVLQYWLIVFVVLSVASLGMFIFGLTKNKEAQNRAVRAEQKLQSYGTPPAYFEQEARSRRSNAFAVMSDDLRTLATLVTGQGTDVGRAVDDKARTMLGDMATRHGGVVNENTTLLTALSELDKQLSDTTANAEKVEAENRAHLAEISSLTGQLQGTREEFESQVNSLSERLQQVEQEMTTAIEQKDTQLQEMQGTLDAREQQLQKMKLDGTQRERGMGIEIGRLENLVAVLQKQIQDLKPGAFDPSAILTKADGRILRAIPGSDVVYINLGAADKVKPGMGFEVYSQTRVVSDSLRGKASLEIVAIMEDTAECRITRRVGGRPIIEGDIVVNIAYERQRKPKFVVRGDFDLDYDGVIDVTGRDQIVTMIVQWGGDVADELDESIDFVVIGLSPQAPTFAEDQRVSDSVREQALQKQLARSRFAALVERAQKMYIPVITQNQFLFLTGYTGDQVFTQR